MEPAEKQMLLQRLCTLMLRIYVMFQLRYVQWTLFVRLQRKYKSYLGLFGLELYRLLLMFYQFGGHR
ncbi:hypothetical protein D3C84_889630 [compost metagenome]